VATVTTAGGVDLESRNPLTPPLLRLHRIAAVDVAFVAAGVAAVVVAAVVLAAAWRYAI
jgi:hypothetical protein